MDEHEDGVVRITLKDVYNAVERLREDVAPLSTSVPDHETRLRALERWTYALPPTFVVAVAGIVTAVVKR